MFKFLFKKEEVVLAFLFGSQAKGSAHKESDIDIAVLFDKKIKSKDFSPQRRGDAEFYFVNSACGAINNN